MGRRRGNSIKAFFDGFNAAYDTTGKVLQDYDMAQVAKAGVTTDTGYTAQDGAELERLAGLKDANGNPLYDIQASADGKYTVRPVGTDPADTSQTATLEPGQRHTYLGETRDTPFGQQDRDRARLSAMAGVMERHGDPMRAMELRGRATDSELRGLQLQQARRKEAGEQELRGIFGGDGQPGTPQGAGAASGTPAQPKVTQIDRDGFMNADIFSRHSDRVVQTYLKQGRIDEARRFQEFTEAREGKEYVRAWDGAMKRVALGDYEGAIPSLHKLYDSFPDGRRVDIQHVGDGTYRVSQIDEASGKLVAQRELSAEQLARFGANALAPEERAKLTIQAEAQAAKEARQTEREGWREDRRDARTQMQIDAMDRRQTRQNGASEGKVTQAQQANNQEIILARKRLSGMNMDDIRGRTEQFLANGRANPQYDPTLAATWRTANQRMVGEDPQFDAFAQKAQPLKPTKQDTPRARFESDPQMRGNRLGKVTGKGWEVYGQDGKLIGYWK